jgi:transposase
MSVSKRSKNQSKKQPRRRRKFTREFKADVVNLCRSGNESVGEVCKRLDLTETAVRRWVEQAEVDEAGGTGDALTTAEREELQRLRREVKRLQMEREILKKAAASSAGHCNGAGNSSPWRQKTKYLAWPAV